MFGEPSQTQYDLHFRLAGIPLRVHPLFWLIAAVLGLREGQPILLLIWVGVVFVSIVVHEMGHALAARGYGMHPSITLWGFGGLTSFDSTRYVPSQHILITLAGPFAGFALAGLVAVSLTLSGYEIRFFFEWTIGHGTDLWDVDPKLNALVFDLLQVNIFWGILNLFPILPLDGGQIARDVLMQINPRGATEQAYRISVVTGGLLAVGALMLRQPYVAILFGYMAYMSYTTLQALRGGGFGSGRGW